MTTALLYGLAAVALIVIGLCGLIASATLLRQIVGMNIMGSGVFLMLVAGAHRRPEAPDPVPHAMVLTGIVVAVSATAMALALARRLPAPDAAEPAVDSQEPGAQ